MYRLGLISSIIIYFFIFTIYASGPVCAGGGSMENVLPARECAKEWLMKDKVSLYTKDTLSDYINGEAELYFPYGFDLVATAVYANRKNPDVWVVADVYRMASLLDAFGIYSNYRKHDAAWVAVGAEGFVSPSQLMFYQDRYFVRLQATGTTDIEQYIFLACGQTVSQNLPMNMDHPRELEALRVQAVVPKSERYIAQSLLGYDFFRRGIIADAILKSERVQVFVVPEVSQQAARKTFEQYCYYLRAEGKDIHLTENPERSSVKAVDPLYGGVFVVHSGRYLIGVIRMKETSAAEEIVEQLRGRIVKMEGSF